MMSDELAFRWDKGGVEGNFGQENISEILFVDSAAEMGETVADHQKIDLKFEIVPHDLVKYFLGDLNFGRFAFHK
jgi:hypothetical protein